MIRILPGLLLVLSVLAAASQASAVCDVIPAANDVFGAAAGEVNAPFAMPGEPLVVRQGSRACPGRDTAPQFQASGDPAPDPDDFVVTTIFLGAAPAAVSTIAGDCAAFLSDELDAIADCVSGLGGGDATWQGCTSAGNEMRFLEDDGRGARLRFPFPERIDVPAGPLARAGPVAFVVTRRGEPFACAAAVTGCKGAAGADTVACVDMLGPPGGCGLTPSTNVPAFASFTALPAPNDYAALCDGSPVTGCESRAPGAKPALVFTLDAEGNALVPWDYRGVQKTFRGVPVARIGRVEIWDVPGGLGVDPLAPLAPIRGSFVSAHAPNGVRVPPVFTPIPAEPDPDESAGVTALFGTIDAPRGVTRIARRSPAARECFVEGSDAARGMPCGNASECPVAGDRCEPARCLGPGGVPTGGLCDGTEAIASCLGGGGACGPPLFDLAAPAVRAALGGAPGAPLALGPDRVTVTAAQAVPLDGIARTDALFAFVENEAIDGEAGASSVNRDGDVSDFVVTRFDRRTGRVEPLREGGVAGRAVSRVQVSRFSFPAVAAEGEFLAFLESEATEGAAAGMPACEDPRICDCAPGRGCDGNDDFDRIDTLVRLFRLPPLDGAASDPVDLLEGWNLPAIPVPFLDGAALRISDRLLYFLGHEGLGQRIRRQRQSELPDGSPLVNVLGAPAESGVPSLDTAGRFVAFQSDAQNVAARTADQGETQIFLRDRATGNLERISESAAGQAAAQGLWPAMLTLNGFPFGAFPIWSLYGASVSGDGCRVSFLSAADNLTADDATDGNGAVDVFVRDRCTVPPTTRRASLAAGSLPASPLSCPFLQQPPPEPIATPLGELLSISALTVPMGVSDAQISRDGRFVVYQSHYTDLDPLADPDPGTAAVCPPPLTEFVPLAIDPQTGAPETATVYVTRLAITAFGFVGEAPGMEVFLHELETGRTELVSRATHPDVVVTDGTRSTRRSFLSGQGLAFGGSSISDDGCLVAYDSFARFDPADDFANCADEEGAPRPCVSVYLRDRCRDETRLVSRPIDGAVVDGDSFLTDVSGDGTTVAFMSGASTLVEGDTNGVFDVFSYDVATGEVQRESVSLARLQAEADPGADASLLDPSDGDSYNGLLSHDARLLLFSTSARNLVVSDDVEGGFDNVWRARTEGALVRAYGGDADDLPIRAVGTNPFLTQIVTEECDPAFSTCVAGEPPGPNGVFVYETDPDDPFNQLDRTDDGDIFDSLLYVVDLDAPALEPKALPSSLQASVAGGAIAFLRPEADFGPAPLADVDGDPFTNDADLDLNGDGDALDRVVHFYPGRVNGALAESAQNLGLAASVVGLSERWVAALAREGTGRPQLPGGELRLWRREGGCPAGCSCQDGWLATGVMADALRIVGDRVALLTPERLLTAGGCSDDGDLNCDGDRDDRFVRLFDLTAAGGCGALATALESPLREAGDMAFGGRILAFRTPQPELCGPAADTLWQACGYVAAPLTEVCSVGRLQVYDAERAALVETQRGVTSCDLESCDPSVPYRVSGTSVRFVTDELVQGCDLDGDLPDAPQTPPGERRFACERLVQVVDVGRDDVAFDDPCQGAAAASTPPATRLLSEIARPFGVDDDVDLARAGVSVNPLADPFGEPEPTPTTLPDLAAATSQPESPAAGEEVASSAGGAQVLIRPGVCVAEDDGRRDVPCRDDTDCTAGFRCDARVLAKVGITDTDGDDVPDALDNCRSFNPDQADRDRDGFGDACDPAPCGLTDSDGDGLGDLCDNCRLEANADQRDTDGDGFGNRCDADLSNDGVVNFADLARLRAVFFGDDPDADLNGDGVVNFADLALMRLRFFQPPGPGAAAAE